MVQDIIITSILLNPCWQPSSGDQVGIRYASPRGNKTAGFDLPYLIYNACSAVSMKYHTADLTKPYPSPHHIRKEQKSLRLSALSRKPLDVTKGSSKPLTTSHLHHTMLQDRSLPRTQPRDDIPLAFEHALCKSSARSGVALALSHALYIQLSV